MSLPESSAFADWASHVYNPWLSETRLLRSSCAAANVVDSFAGIGKRTEAIRWNNTAAADHRKKRVFAGPWCRALTDKVDRSTRAEFWDLIRATPSLDWLLLFDGGTEKSVKLPPDWGSGFANCWVGVKLAGPRSASDQLEAVRSIPAQHRFAVAAPLLGDLGDLTLHGLHWLIAQISDECAVDSEAIVSLKLQCMAFGIPFWLEDGGKLTERMDGWGRFSYHEAPAS